MAGERIFAQAGLETAAPKFVKVLKKDKRGNGHASLYRGTSLIRKYTPP